VEKIRAKSLRQTGRLIGLAAERGWEIRSPREAERRGGSVAIRVPHAREVAAELNASDVLCDYRPKSGIRLAPHFYNADREIDAAVEAIDDILRDGRWKRHEERGGIVT
ncbi:MAG: hypothetical protein WBX15_08830, partial [Thermoanaerobaculia bacterium]